MSALSHHWDTIRQALAAERERQNVRICFEEPEFLPAALEVSETPVSPTARWTARILLSMLVVTLLWATLGKVDVVASAPGRILPAANVQLVQASNSGVVRRIYVKDGDHVRKGQPLLDLDPTVSTADEEQAQRALQAAQLDVARNRAIADALAGHGLHFTPPPGTDPVVATTQFELVKAQVAEADASVGSLAAARRSALADAASSSQQIHKFDDTLPMLDKQLASLDALRKDGLITENRWLDMRRQRRAELGDRDVAIEQRQRATSDAAKFGRQLTQSRAQALRQALADLAKAQSDAAIKTEDWAKARQRSKLQRLVAPVDGTVQQLAVHTVGGVAEPIKPLMSVIPRGQLMIEARILNRDAGFVRAGQIVAVKLDAFTFTRYGTVPGVIESISADAVDDRKLGSVYVARILLNTDHVMADGNYAPLTSGMSIVADITTGRRSILSYLISPIEAARKEAAREH